MGRHASLMLLNAVVLANGLCGASPCLAATDNGVISDVWGYCSLTLR